jgi:hypothetical protein
MKRQAGVSACVIVVTVSLIAASRALGGEPPEARTQQEKAVTVVEEFYAYHFKHDMAFTRKSVEARRKWLSRRLYRGLLAEFERGKNTDEVPRMDGDPFTDSQEYPTGFRLDGAKPAGRGYRVTVNLKWPTEERVVEVDVLQHKGRWEIDDLRYGGRRTLRAFLSGAEE